MTRLSDGEIERLREGILAKGAQCTELPTEMLAALFEELQSLRAASEWRTDMENAPDDGTEILIANFTDPMVIQNDYWTAGGIAFDEYPGWCDWPPGAHDPTHWKPITPPDSTNTDILASQESDGN